MSSKQGQGIDPEELRKRKEQTKQKQQILKQKEEERLQKLAEKREAARTKASKGLTRRSEKGIWDKYSEYIIWGAVGLVLVIWWIYTKFFHGEKGFARLKVLDPEWITNLNDVGGSWIARDNDFFAGVSLGDSKKLFSNYISRTESLAKCTNENLKNEVPESYDFRESHPKCVGSIVDQGKCSSSFAVTPITAFSERLCRMTEEKVIFRGSIQQGLTCENKRGNGKLRI